MRSLNLDNLSATVPHPQVVSSMLPFLGGKKFGNPSSPHHLGEEPRRAVETARERMAGLLSALPEEILFTASGSESNNLAIKGILAGRDGRHIVTSAVEHMSVLHPIRTLSELGYRVTFLQVDGTGEVDPKDLRKSLKPDTALVSICHAIGEVGTVQPIHELASIAAER
ncbi:MAG: aminotransferase class V-fold PLP-dependent enzyme, partial [Acidobacteria bacterium]|nr:aminotransferase class V-fold PLP-dependent enzyme [Acidobacteriota bacterium]